MLSDLELSSAAAAVATIGLFLTVQKGLSPSLVACEVSRVGLAISAGNGNINSSYKSRITSEQESR